MINDIPKYDQEYFLVSTNFNDFGPCFWHMFVKDGQYYEQKHYLSEYRKSPAPSRWGGVERFEDVRSRREETYAPKANGYYLYIQKRCALRRYFRDKGVNV